MFLGFSILIIAILLTGAFALTAFSTSLRRINKTDAKKQIQSLKKLFFYRSFHRFFFPSHEYEGFFFGIISAQNIVRFGYVAVMLLTLSQTQIYVQAITSTVSVEPLSWLWLALSLLGVILLAFVVGDYLPRIFGNHYPATAMRVCAPIASLFLILAFPLTFIFLKIAQKLSRTIYLDTTNEAMGKDEIIDMIQKADISSNFDIHDKKLIESVVMFKELIVREVMVPRVEMFSLPAEISIKEAARLLEGEWFSRTPVYRNTVDNIVGVLMVKDILKKFSEYEQNGRDSKILEAPIESIQKNVLHVPETKRISSLLQEFRKKQVHLAIVVDEYGGTEGIVTIEDILEEIVGDIADEYDEEEASFFAQSDGTWVVDARMSILDIEDELNIKIPQEGEYDTIGGYVFHTAGTIPEKGFVIHHDEFEMEILQSNNRCVEKVRIKPVLTPRSDKD